MEYLLGKVQGQLEGIVASQDRMERALDTHIEREEEAFRTIHGRIDLLHARDPELTKPQLFDAEGAKLPWKVIVVLVVTASAGSGGLVHLLGRVL